VRPNLHFEDMTGSAATSPSYDPGVPARRLRALVCALAVLAALGVAGPALAAQTGFVSALGQTVSGPDKATDLGVGWVRLFLNWKDSEPADGTFNAPYFDLIAREVAAYRARGVKVLVVATSAPQWASGSASGIAPPTDPAQYAAFVDHAMTQLPGVTAWEVWNEADGSLFWENGPQPAAYAALLRAAYPVIKARDPAATVVSTGMVANDFGFLEQLYANGAGGFFDAVGIHTDTACLIAAPTSYYRELDGRIGRFAFTGYREVHDVMAQHGDGAKPIWLTEMGWNTSTTAANSCRDGDRAGTKPAGVTQADQSRFLTDAYECLEADPFVTVTMWFSLQDTPGSLHYDAYLGLLRTNGAAKPAYAALKALRNGTNVKANAACGGRLDHAAPALQVVRPSNGLRFSDRLSLRAIAADAPGGTGIGSIELVADGKRVVKSKGGAFELDPWFRSRDQLGPGAHTLTFRARDNAGNVAERSVQVEKVAASQLPRIQTRLALRARSRSGRRVRLQGSLTYAPTELPVAGRVYIALERRTGGRYRRVKLVSADAGRAFALTAKLPSSGRYRALARYKGAAPFGAARSPYRTFGVR
jgi:hypothetical protein